MSRDSKSSIVIDGTITATGIIGSTLTSGRVVLVTTGGLMTDSSALTYAGGTFTATAFSGSGASLTGLNAANLATGTVPTARLGSGTANTTTFLRGDNTWQTLSGIGGGGTVDGTTVQGVTLQWDGTGGSTPTRQLQYTGAGTLTHSDAGNGTNVIDIIARKANTSEIQVAQWEYGWVSGHNTDTSHYGFAELTVADENNGARSALRVEATGSGVKVTLGGNSIAGLAPIGSVISWLKANASTPALPSGWVECNGQTLSDSESVYNGQAMPNVANTIVRVK